MASSNKTKNIGLNYWSGTDRAKRTDFNNDNKTIDDFFTTIMDDILTTGVVEGGLVKENTNNDLSVNVEALIAYGEGVRLYTNSERTVDCSKDVDGNSTAVITDGNEKWISLYVTKEEGETIFEVYQGTEAAAGSAEKPSIKTGGRVLLADILLTYGQTEILDNDIDTERREKVTDKFAAGYIKTIDSDVVITVGPSGDYNSINEALEHASLYYPRYKKEGLMVEIRLLSGFVMKEQVLIENIDLGYIIITSEDDEVTISRQHLTKHFAEQPSNLTDETNYQDPDEVHVFNVPAFGANNNATLPIINVLFNMDDTGDYEGRNAFSVANNSRIYIMPYKGCINAGENGIYVTQGSWAVAYRANFDNAGRNLTHEDATGHLSGALCFRGSWMNLRQATVTNASRDGIYLGSSSVVDAWGADFSGAGRHGIFCYSNGRINASEATITNCGVNSVYGKGNAHIEVGFDYKNLPDLSGAGENGILAKDNAIINANHAIIKNCGLRGVRATRGSIINVYNASITNNGSEGIYASSGSRVNCVNADVSGNTGVDIRIDGGSIVSAFGTTGTVSETENEITNAGIIFR